MSARLMTGLTAVLCLLSLCWLLPAQAAGVSASLNRTHAQLGDTVTLTVKVNGHSSAKEPSWDALLPDFNVLGTSSSSSFSFINGHGSESLSWIVQLQPRKTGKLRIPSFTVAGQHTAPLTLAVGSAPATSAGPKAPVFVDMAADTLTPYVGQQVRLTVRLYYAVNLGSASMSQPTGDGLQVRKAGQNTYQTTRNGRHYTVLEQHYAVIPQRSGSLVLQPVIFQGRQAGNGGSGFFGGFFNNIPGWGGGASGGKTIRIHTQALNFTVHAVPPGQGKGPWLPARQILLSLSGLPADGKVQAGQPLTLTLKEQAKGLPFESLPKPSLPKLRGADLYPDRIQNKTTFHGGWLVGRRTRQFAVIPQQTGKLTIPEITLSWWNVEKNQPAQASIPAHTLTVIAAPGAQTGAGNTTAQSMLATKAVSPSAKPLTDTASKSAVHALELPKAPTQPATHGMFWRWLAAAALVLWLLTLLALMVLWGWRRRRRAMAAAPAPEPATPAETRTPARKSSTARQFKQAFLQATRTPDVHVQSATLLAWARSLRPQLQTFGELAAALQSTAQRKAIEDLQRACYAPGAEPADGEALRHVFAKGFNWRDEKIKPHSDLPSLPPLYPE